MDVERGRTVKGWRPRRLGEYILPSRYRGLFVDHFAFSFPNSYAACSPLFPACLLSCSSWLRHKHLHMSVEGYTNTYT